MITQGIWKMSHNLLSCTIIVEENSGFKVLGTCTSDDGLLTFDEMESNAQLMAEAPKMASLLEKIQKEKELTPEILKELFLITDIIHQIKY